MTEKWCEFCWSGRHTDAECTKNKCSRCRKPVFVNGLCKGCSETDTASRSKARRAMKLELKKRKKVTKRKKKKPVKVRSAKMPTGEFGRVAKLVDVYLNPEQVSDVRINDNKEIWRSPEIRSLSPWERSAAPKRDQLQLMIRHLTSCGANKARVYEDDEELAFTKERCVSCGITWVRYRSGKSIAVPHLGMFELPIIQEDLDSLRTHFNYLT